MCTKDCQDCEDAKNLKDEIESAETSVDRAIGFLVDLLDDLRVASPEEQERLHGKREEFVTRIKKLRADLDQIKKKDM